MVSIKDVARKANVSKSTVSRVVSKNGYVNTETREMVEKAMGDLNYRPNMFAKGMRTNCSHSVGIIFPDLSNPFFSEWYQVVDRISRERGYLNYICITDPKGETEELRVDDLLARSIDGIILFSYRKEETFLEKLRELNKHTPVICCDSMFQDEGISCISADGRKGTYDAVLKLYESGKRRIAYLTGKEEYQVVNNRFMGYCKALGDLGLPVNESLILEGEFSKDCGVQAAEKLMNIKEPPDAIMAATDIMAMGVLEYLQKNGHQVPKDVAVFGFDNLQASQNTIPALSTISLPIQEMAKKTITSLIDLMKEPKTKPIKHVFNCELVIRESS